MTYFLHKLPFIMFGSSSGFFLELEFDGYYSRLSPSTEAEDERKRNRNQ